MGNMKTITLKDLQEAEACYWNADGTPANDLAKRVEENLPATLHEIMCWDWVHVDDREWVLDKFATREQRRAYEKATAKHVEAYQKAIAKNWETYQKAKAPELKEATK
jgi:hypothetical protein